MSDAVGGLKNDPSFKVILTLLSFASLILKTLKYTLELLSISKINSLVCNSPIKRIETLQFFLILITPFSLSKLKDGKNNSPF
jgi:hypothetical protein